MEARTEINNHGYIVNTTLKLKPTEVLIITAALHGMANNIERHIIDKEKARLMLEKIIGSIK